MKIKSLLFLFFISRFSVFGQDEVLKKNSIPKLIFTVISPDRFGQIQSSVTWKRTVLRCCKRRFPMRDLK